MRNPLSIAAALALFTLPPALACSSSAEFSEPSRADIRPRPENPVELGRVRWKRDLDAALAEARAAKKPVFALFQEIPGCATCRKFGEGPLSNPLLVEAIEELFVPVATYNNRQGDDAQVLARFGEPAWNNPVVRFLDGGGEDLIPRRDRVWSTAGIARRAIDALEAAGRSVPAWLTTVAPEADARDLATATFTMGCFWSGEAALGALDGVVTTRAAWVGGREAVEVTYDPSAIDAGRLASAAEQSACSVSADAPTRDARESDRKVYLRPAHRLLPLSPMQRTKVNAALGQRRDPAPWLSPSQRDLLVRIAAVLEEDPERLEGLRAPASSGELETYRRRLEALVAPSAADRAGDRAGDGASDGASDGAAGDAAPR